MDDIHLKLPAELLAPLRARVRFDSDADVAAFVADAIAVYADLGTLSRTPGVLMWHPERGTPRRVRLPGEHPDAGEAVQRDKLKKQ